MRSDQQIVGRIVVGQGQARRPGLGASRRQQGSRFGWQSPSFDMRLNTLHNLVVRHSIDGTAAEKNQILRRGLMRPPRSFHSKGLECGKRRLQRLHDRVRTLEISTLAG